VADVLMRKYKLPFRVGHHFASEVVSFAKERNITPRDFPTPMLSASMQRR
jgi:argininosuccinate lyase